jgi:hypothetical protein
MHKDAKNKIDEIPLAVFLKCPNSSSRHFVPGYYRADPPGQKPFAHRNASQLFFRYPALRTATVPGRAT